MMLVRCEQSWVVAEFVSHFVFGVDCLLLEAVDRNAVAVLVNSDVPSE